MQQLKLPQSPFVTPNFMVAGEWLVFLNEFIRLLNLLTSSGTIDAAQEQQESQWILSTLKMMRHKRE